MTPENANRSRQVQAGAVSSSQTNVFIDGFSLKNPVNHGGVAGQNFSPGNPFPQLAVQEFSVQTQNFKAEYEQAGSAIISAVTKTGGQEFHGDAFGEFQPKSFLGRPYFDRAGNANNPNGTNPKGDYDRKQYGADIGGPIIKNLLHFYFAFEGETETLPSTTVNLNAGADDRVPTDIAAANNGTFPKSFKQRLYFGKLTLFASRRRHDQRQRVRPQGEPARRLRRQCGAQPRSHHQFGRRDVRVAVEPPPGRFPERVHRRPTTSRPTAHRARPTGRRSRWNARPTPAVRCSSKTVRACAAQPSPPSRAW